jgi:PAS domain S-box-containing protein
MPRWRRLGAGFASWPLIAIAILALVFAGTGASCLDRQGWPLYLASTLAGLALGVVGCQLSSKNGQTVASGSTAESADTRGLSEAPPLRAGSMDFRGQGENSGSITVTAALGGEREFAEAVIETAQLAVLILDPSGTVMLANRFFQETTGYEPSDLGGRNWFESLVPLEARDHSLRVFQESQRAGAGVEDVSPVLARGGAQRHFSWRWRALRDSGGAVRAVLGLGMDLTERDGMEDALRKTEERYRAIVEDQTELISRFRPDGTITFVNGAYCRYFGEEPEMLLGHKFWHHVPRHEQERLRRHIQRLSPDNPVSTIEHPVKTPQGIRWQQWTDRAILDGEGKVVELQAVGRDITERKRVEQALASERSRLYSVLDSLPVFVFLHSADYTIRFANRFFLRTFGEGTGRRCYSVLKGRSEPCTECRSRDVFLNHHPQSWEWVADAGGRTYQMHSYPFSDVDETPLILQLGIDISDQKRNEMEMRQSEARLRELSSRLLTAQEEERRRIAAELHDSIGSSLTGISVFLQTVLLQIDEGSSLRESVTKLVSVTRSTIQEARRIMSDLRPSMLDDLGIVKTLEWLCREFQQLHPSIRIEKAIEIQEDDIPEPLKITIFRLVQEALHNVAKHSRAELVTLTLDEVGGRIRLMVEDNGDGFSVPESLWEEPQKKGLGLNSMRERVDLSGGRFSLDSRVGEGTIVTAQWPSSSSGEGMG